MLSPVGSALRARSESAGRRSESVESECFSLILSDAQEAEKRQWPEQRKSDCCVCVCGLSAD